MDIELGFHLLYGIFWVEIYNTYNGRFFYANYVHTRKNSFESLGTGSCITIEKYDRRHLHVLVHT